MGEKKKDTYTEYSDIFNLKGSGVYKLPPIEETLKNFIDIEEKPVREFYKMKQNALWKEKQYEARKNAFRKDLKNETVVNPFSRQSVKQERNNSIQEETYPQIKEGQGDGAKIKSFLDFTGGWISLLILLVNNLFIKRQHRIFGKVLDMTAAIQTFGVTLMNVRNWLAGEREFSPLSAYDSSLRQERSLPLKERRELRPLPPANLYLRQEPGVQFGRYGKKYVGKPQSMSGHVLVIGQPGVGKSTAFAIPTLSRWTGGVFCTDIKGELSKNSTYRNNTFIVDPEDETTYGYDPFDDLRRVSENDRVHYLNGILYSLLPDSPDGKDTFWTQSGRRYLAGAYLYAMHRDMSFIEINSEIYKTSADDMIRQVMNSGYKDAKAHMVHIQEEDNRTRGSILQNAMNAIEIFATDHKIMELMTRRKTVNPEMLLTGSRIFLRIDDERMEDWKPFMTIMVNQFIRGMTRFPDQGNQRILVLLDEFPRLGKIPSIVDGLATLRSRGCTFCILVQSYSQIDKIYGEIERRIILDNTAYKLVMSIMDPKMAEETSQMIGQHYESETVPNTEKGIKRLLKKRTKRQVYLVRPESLRNLGKEVVLIAPEGHCKLIKTYYFKEK